MSSTSAKVTGSGGLARLPERIEIRDVGPRDGLQPEEPVAVADRVALVEGLVAVGLRHVEAAAFVSPKAVPAMADGAEVMARVTRTPGVRYAALVPNLRGATDALGSGVDEITVTVSISETYNQRNVGMATEESVAVIGEVCRAAVEEVPVDAVVSCAFGSPYEGEVEPRAVAQLAERLGAAGCARVTLADTTGMATPRGIGEVIAQTGPGVGLHLHDTRGTALVNAYAAMAAGITRFDAAVGGLGGSPFAEGAAGNLATEELVALCDDLGVATGIDVEALVSLAGTLAGLVGHPVPSRVALAGPRTRRVEGG